MADEQTLTIKIKVDADTKKIQVIEGDLKKFQDAVDSAGKKSSDGSKGLSSMEKNLNALTEPLGLNLAGFAGVAGAIGLVAGTIAGGISKWEEEKKLNREVAGVVSGLGLNYEQLKASIDSNLESLKSNTKFTDEQMKNSFTQALKYTGDTTQAYKLLQIAQNVSVGTGKTLEEVMGTLGSAMKGGERTTKILYQEFGKLGVQGKDVSEMIDNLGNAYKNNAKDEQSIAKTTTELKEGWEDTASAIGEQVVPSLIEVGEVLKPVVIGFTNFIGLVVTGFMQITDAIVLAVTQWKNIFTMNIKGMEKANDDFVKKSAKRWNDYGTSVIKASERMNSGKQKTDKDYGKFHAKTLKDELGDEKQFGKEKDDLARKLDKIQQENEKNSYSERMKLLDAEVVKYRKAGADEKDIVQYYEAEKKRITLDEESRKGKAKKELETIEADDAKRTSEGQIRLLKESYDSDLENYRNQLSNKELTQAEYDSIRLAREKKLSANITSIYQAEFETQMSILSSFMGSLTGAFGEATSVGKASAIAQATIDTYAGANKALATYPPPFSFIAMATAITAGLINVSKIASIPLMAEGGIVSKGQQFIAGEAGKEAIIPLDSPTGKKLLGSGNSGGVNIESIQILFPNVSSFDDWLKADPKIIKDVVERKILQAFNQLSKEGKMTSVSKVNNI